MRNEEELKIVESRLLDLVKCVLEKSREDEAFATRLSDILMSDAVRSTLREKKVKKSQETKFNPFESYHSLQRDGFRSLLLSKPEDELRKMARSFKIVRKSAIDDALTPEELVSRIIDFVELELRQGDAFIRNGSSKPMGGEVSDKSPLVA